MQEQSSLHGAPAEAYLEHATTIPPAPHAHIPQPAEPVAPAAQAPAYSRTQRSVRWWRLLLIRIIRGFGAFGRALRPHALTLAILVISLGVIGWLSALLWMPSGDMPSFSRADSIPPAVAVENFLRGQQNFDGAQMWDSLSEAVKAQLLSRGDSKPTWETRAQMEKRSGQKYGNFQYIGGVGLPDGGSMYFYLVDVESPRPDRGGPTSYVFTVDADGKIVNIE
jgi:hypothetical protein